MSEPPFKDGIICSQADWDLQQTQTVHNTTIHCLTRGQSIGLTLPVETGLLSLTAVLVVFVLIILNVRRYRRKFSDRKWKLFQEPSDVFMASLFTFDAAQAVGAIMDLKWIIAGKVFVSPFCSAQGAVQQLGETGVAITTLAIAVHTFITVWWGIGIHATKAAWLVTFVIWLYVGLFVIIGNAVHANKSTLYESPTPYWCWIGYDYKAQRIMGEYIWLWLTLIFSFAAYLPLFFSMRGNIAPGRRWYNWTWRSNPRLAKTPEARFARKRARDMLAYPASYSLIALPLCIVRWVGFGREASGKSVPSSATIAAVSLFGLSGIVNVLLFLGTRPDRLLFAREPPPELEEVIALPPSDHERSISGGSELPQKEAVSPSETLGGLLSASGWDPNPPRPGTGTTHETARN
jgi:hypothetical protein